MKLAIGCKVELKSGMRLRVTGKAKGKWCGEVLSLRTDGNFSQSKVGDHMVFLLSEVSHVIGGEAITCPNCKSPLWDRAKSVANTTTVFFTCKRCGHQWGED